MTYDIYFLSNVAGVTGVTLVLLAYFFSQTGRLPIDSFKYLFSNLIGSLFIVFSLCFHWNLSSFLIELIWSGISIMGLIKVFRKKVSNSPSKMGEIAIKK